jgi:hypothetical protein
MRWIVLFSLCLWMGFAALVVAARGIGAEQPSSALVEAMYLNDCALPCWIGITPGMASVDEAIAQLSRVFHLSASPHITNTLTFDYSMSEYRVTVSDDDATIIFIVSKIDGTVNQFAFFLSDQSVQLGDIVLAYGAPTCFSQRDVSTWNIVYHSAGRATIFIQTGRALRYTHPIQVIMFAPHPQASPNRSCLTTPGIRNAWHGIAPAWRYSQLSQS